MEINKREIGFFHAPENVPVAHSKDLVLETRWQMLDQGREKKRGLEEKKGGRKKNWKKRQEENVQGKELRRKERRGKKKQEARDIQIGMNCPEWLVFGCISVRR